MADGRRPTAPGLVVKLSKLSEAAKTLVSRLAEAIRATRQVDGQGHCYFVKDGDRTIAGPFPDTPAGKAAAEGRAQRERDKRAARS